MSSKNDTSTFEDAAALGKLFDEHQARLLAMLRRRMDPALARRVDPEDILSEAFLQARRRWPTFKEQAQVAPYVWLYRIALDQLIEAHRRETRERRDCRLDVAWPKRSSVQLAFHLVDTGTGPSSALQREELQDRFQKMLALLSDRDREILGMRHFDQLSFKDVASVLDITVKTATVRYTRALKRLKALWESIQ